MQGPGSRGACTGRCWGGRTGGADPQVRRRSGERSSRGGGSNRSRGCGSARGALRWRRVGCRPGRAVGVENARDVPGADGGLASVLAKFAVVVGHGELRALLTLGEPPDLQLDRGEKETLVDTVNMSPEVGEGVPFAPRPARRADVGGVRMRAVVCFGLRGGCGGLARGAAPGSRRRSCWLSHGERKQIVDGGIFEKKLNQGTGGVPKIEAEPNEKVGKSNGSKCKKWAGHARRGRGTETKAGNKQGRSRCGGEQAGRGLPVSDVDVSLARLGGGRRHPLGQGGGRGCTHASSGPARNERRARARDALEEVLGSLG